MPYIVSLVFAQLWAIVEKAGAKNSEEEMPMVSKIAEYNDTLPGYSQ
jgi:hypothetical protein